MTPHLLVRGIVRVVFWFAVVAFFFLGPLVGAALIGASPS